MPNDTYGGLYINKELVKGSWYGVCSGPKPQVFTGNINNTGDLENIRNKSLYISSASSSNGTFPDGTYGHNFAVLTIRYGEGNGLYIQKAVDLSVNPILEYERAWNNNWTAWARVTSFGDASQAAATAQSTADSAKKRTEYLYKITGYSDGTTSANPTLNSRIKTNSDNIDTINRILGSTPNGQTINGRIDSLLTGSANDRVARDHSNKLVNGDVRQGQLAGIKIYTNQNGFSINPGDTSVRVLDEGNMSSWGFNGSNSVFLVSNANGDLNGAHVVGGTFVPPISGQNRGGWYAVFNGSNNVGILLNWTLIVFNQSIS
jgi:hypothetical protein